MLCSVITQHAIRTRQSGSHKAADAQSTQDFCKQDHVALCLSLPLPLTRMDLKRSASRLGSLRFSGMEAMVHRLSFSRSASKALVVPSPSSARQPRIRGSSLPHKLCRLSPRITRARPLAHPWTPREEREKAAAATVTLPLRNPPSPNALGLECRAPFLSWTQKLKQAGGACRVLDTALCSIARSGMGTD